MRGAIVFEAPREGYGIDQIRQPMTVGALRRILEDYNDDTLFILSHDNGYTCGSISEYQMELYTENEDGEFEAEEDAVY